MERFQFLVKKKIAKQLSDGEATELQELLEEREDCRLIFQTFFSRNDGLTEVDAEKAFALHLKKMRT